MKMSCQRKKHRNYDRTHSGVSNDDIARETARFIEPIREISAIDHKDALAEAYGSVFETNQWWYTEEGENEDGYTS